jgi:hypothetical protein
MHENVMLGLENQHIVEGPRNTQRHSVRERALTKRVDQKYRRSGGNRGGICDTDPRPHAEPIAKFPLTTHVGKDADKEVEDNELEGATVVQPLV